LKGTINKLKIVGTAVVVLIVVSIVLQNTPTVESRLLFLTVTMPNAALLFGTLIIGFAISVLTAGYIASRAKQRPPDLASAGCSHGADRIVAGGKIDRLSFVGNRSNQPKQIDQGKRIYLNAFA
jgi:uncharacterized integral membrane protein